MDANNFDVIIITNNGKALFDDFWQDLLQLQTKEGGKGSMQPRFKVKQNKQLSDVSES